MANWPCGFDKKHVTLPFLEDQNLYHERRNMKVTYSYRTDLTENQWQIIKKWIPIQKKGPKQVCRRRIINAILYLTRPGCQWRNIPLSFPKWKTVYNVFWHWRNDGIWKKNSRCLMRFHPANQG
jgi:transposase